MSASASSDDGVPRTQPSNAFDGQYNNFWHASGSDTFPKYLQADLGSSQTLTRINSYYYGGYANTEWGNLTRDFDVWVGDNASFEPGSYTVAAQVRDNTNWITQVDFAPVTGQYVRYVAYGAYGSQYWNTAVYELELWSRAAAPQTVTFTSSAPTDAVVGAPTYAVVATATSELPVTFAIDPTSAAVCSLGAGNVVSFSGPGTCTILADQGGNASWLPAAQVFQSFGVGKADQAIDFGQPAERTYGDAPFDLNATGGASGNPVTFAVSPADVCTIEGSRVTIVGAGSCDATASQAGNDNYLAAPDVVHWFTIARAP